MLLGILSDSHDHLDRIHAGVDRLVREGIEVLIHPGDIIAPFAAKAVLDWQGPLHVVYGNNDGERNGLKVLLPQIVDGPLLVEVGGICISLDHYPPDETHPPIENVRAIIYGHTHQIVNETRGGVLHLNPGECCGWVTGKPTVATLDTDNMHVEIVPLD
ncbi:MAG: metallophosphoesterase [Planctomycetota bacterium]|nr:metallophosphoesterase [Planctomycetota bacterium]